MFDCPIADSGVFRKPVSNFAFCLVELVLQTKMIYFTMNDLMVK